MEGCDLGLLFLDGADQHGNQPDVVDAAVGFRGRLGVLLVGSGVHGVVLHQLGKHGFQVSGEKPELLFDYYGFPEHTYRLAWPAPGAPDVARRAAALVADAGFPVREETARGWDHGVFIPMMVAVPGADIPLAQMSLRKDLDPAAHIAIGRALAPLRDEGVLIVGSGMSFHNLRARGPQVTPVADEWDAALTAAVTDPDPAARAERVAQWESLPHARFAHPEEEHLMPLMVALGAGGDGPAVRDYADHVLGWAVSGYRFG